MSVAKECNIPLRGLNEVSSATLGHARRIVIKYNDKVGVSQIADLSPNTPSGNRKMMWCLKDSADDELTVVKLYFSETDTDKEAAVFNILDELEEIEMRFLSVVIDIHMTSVSDGLKKNLSTVLGEIARNKRNIKEELGLTTPTSN